MKTRIITGIIMAIIVAPLLVFGGYFSFALSLILLIGGIYEFLSIKKKANQNIIPLYIYFICGIFAYMLIYGIPVFGLDGIDYTNATLPSFNISPLLLILFFLIMFALPVFDKKFEIYDSMYSLSSTLYLSLGIKGFLYIRSHGGIDNLKEGLILILFLLLVTCLTDIFAYFGGMTCYKLLGNEKIHKLNERISAKKTIEGTIIGTLFGTVGGFLFGLFVVNNLDNINYSWYFYLIISFILSIIGQIGDLILSSIKRHFNVKDYSNLLPGHGGILDRVDSLLANSMIFAMLLVLF